MNALLVEQALVDGLAAKRESERQARIAERGTDRKQNLYVTDLGSFCDRKTWLSLYGPEPEPLDTTAEVTFGVGHAVEEWVAGVLGHAGLGYAREVHIDLDHRQHKITGRVDFLLLADFGLIELKSISWRSFTFMLDRGEQGRPEHRHQLNGYLEASQRGALAAKDEQGFLSVIPPQTSGTLLYVPKESDYKDRNAHIPFKAFDVAYDPTAFTQAADRLVTIAEWPADPGKPATFRADRFPCGSRKQDGTIKSWCAHFKHCYPEQEDEYGDE